MDKSEPRANAPSLNKPKPKDMTFGPRPVNLAPKVNISRCAQCGAVLTTGQDDCAKCGFALHSCKQCAYFDPAERFECRKPIPERVARKDQRNTCTFYTIAVRLERETSNSNGANASVAQRPSSPTRADDARRAFENLFKK